MDPISQAVVGAALPQSVMRGRRLVLAALFGGLAGMTADLDSLIQSSADPLLYVEYHRQFSHSLLFIPVGGLLCAALFHLALGRRWAVPFRWTALCCVLGYGTHGLLDAMTSYGTQLLWPFSDLRVAWSVVSIVDPLFTVPLLILVGLGMWRRSRVYGGIALAWVALYLGMGWLQHRHALELGATLAASRGHTPEQISTKPSFGNLVVWKHVYRQGERYYVDAIRPWPDGRIYPGQSALALDLARDLPWLDPATQQARDVARFRRFSQGYLAFDPAQPDRVFDVRYSILPNEIESLWSLVLERDADADAHADYVTDRGDTRAKAPLLWRMIAGDEIGVD